MAGARIGQQLHRVREALGLQPRRDGGGHGAGGPDPVARTADQHDGTVDPLHRNDRVRMARQGWQSARIALIDIAQRAAPAKGQIRQGSPAEGEAGGRVSVDAPAKTLPHDIGGHGRHHRPDRRIVRRDEQCRLPAHGGAQNADMTRIDAGPMPQPIDRRLEIFERDELQRLRQARHAEIGKLQDRIAMPSDEPGLVADGGVESTLGPAEHDHAGQRAFRAGGPVELADQFTG